MVLLEVAHPSLLRAITRWMELWDHITRDMDHEILLKAGLTRHCHENCTLARHLAKAYQMEPDHVYFKTIGHKSLTPIFSLLVSYDSVENRVAR